MWCCHWKINGLHMIAFVLCVIGVASQDFTLAEAQIRFAHLRCMQHYPGADTINYSSTHDTHCYLQCVLYKTGLMNLNTRGLDSSRLLDIWDDIAEDFDANCTGKLMLEEPLNGQCSDYYRKIMELRFSCHKLFEYLFGLNVTVIYANSSPSKSLGESASEYCDSIENDEDANVDDSEQQNVSFVAEYRKKLQCVFENTHYLDAYGRVDESEVLLSYQEGNADTAKAKAAVHYCVHRANAKYQQDNAGALVLELQTCLKATSPEYMQVARMRDEISRGF